MLAVTYCHPTKASKLQPQFEMFLKTLHCGINVGIILHPRKRQTITEALELKATLQKC